MMNDITGKEICIGDTVAFNPPSYKGLTTGTVVKMTPKMVRVSFKNSYGMNETVVFPHDVVIIRKVKP